MPRYRYITAGIVHMDDQVNQFRLVAGNKLGMLRNTLTMLRVTIPDDMELTKYDCDEYSTTDDTRQIVELHPLPMSRVNGRLKAFPELLYDPRETWEDAMRSRYGLWPTTDGTWLTKDRWVERVAESQRLVRMAVRDDSGTMQGFPPLPVTP